MGKISFARVDQRLIHGQVVMTVTTITDANIIYVVDNELAKDDFMKQILAGSAKNANMKFKAFSVEGIIQEWKDNQFGDDKVLLLTKNVDTMLEVAEGGVEIDFINIGNHTKPADGVSVINTAGVNKVQFDRLEKLTQSGTEVYFQTKPGQQPRVNLTDAKGKFK